MSTGWKSALLRRVLIASIAVIVIAVLLSGLDSHAVAKALPAAEDAPETKDDSPAQDSVALDPPKEEEETGETAAAPAEAAATAPEEGANKYAGSCLQAGCHDTLKGRAKLHGPVASESCGMCHTAVEGKEHSFDLAHEEEELCTACHDMPDPAKVVHKPFSAKACLGCHDPHGGDTSALLVKADEPGGVCLTCHSKSDARDLHKPVAEGRCTQCHSPHQSDEEALLVDAGATACLKCHSKLAETLKAAKSVHKPAGEGQCRSCHRGHESPFPPLLASSYPRSKYAGFDEKTYAMCLQCHPIEAFTERESSRTGFRDGTRNLHYLHVNKPRKGRTCGLCHEPHESSNPHLLKTKVPFGTWEIEIGFQPAADGGTCSTGCHRKATYSRGSDSSAPAGNGKEVAPSKKKAGAAKKAGKTKKAPPPASGAEIPAR